MSKRIYTAETPVLREALALIPKFAGLPDDASAPRRLQAMAEFFVERVHEDESHAAKLRAYEAMAADSERSERIRRNTRARISAGLL